MRKLQSITTVAGKASYGSLCTQKQPEFVADRYHKGCTLAQPHHCACTALTTDCADLGALGYNKLACHTKEVASTGNERAPILSNTGQSLTGLGNTLPRLLTHSL